MSVNIACFLYSLGTAGKHDPTDCNWSLLSTVAVYTSLEVELKHGQRWVHNHVSIRRICCNEAIGLTNIGHGVLAHPGVGERLTIRLAKIGQP